MTTFKADPDDSDELWCCKTTKDDCIFEGENVICLGNAIPLTQPCHNYVVNNGQCNYYPEDHWRNAYGEHRSYIVDICLNDR